MKKEKPNDLAGINGVRRTNENKQREEAVKDSSRKWETHSDRAKAGVSRVTIQHSVYEETPLQLAGKATQSNGETFIFMIFS